MRKNKIFYFQTCTLIPTASCGLYMSIVDDLNKSSENKLKGILRNFHGLWWVWSRIGAHRSTDFVTLKGQCHETCDHLFGPKTLQGPHLNRFRELFRFCEDIREKHVSPKSLTTTTPGKFFWENNKLMRKVKKMNLILFAHLVTLSV